jgi:hypothetical protein
MESWYPEKCRFRKAPWRLLSETVCPSWVSKNSLTPIARIPSCRKISPKTISTQVEAWAILIVVFEGFQTFQRPHPQLMTIAAASGAGPAICTEGKNCVVTLTTVNRLPLVLRYSKPEIIQGLHSRSPAFLTVRGVCFSVSMTGRHECVGRKYFTPC